MDEYTDEIRDLISEAGYDSEPITAVVKFRRGLNSYIHEPISRLVHDHPAHNDPEAWYRVASILDQNHADMEALYPPPPPISEDRPEEIPVELVPLPPPPPTVIIQPVEIRWVMLQAPPKSCANSFEALSPKPEGLISDLIEIATEPTASTTKVSLPPR